ncbi:MULTISPECIES: hypothetical protein [unclassified Methylosinus]|uniref:hypothetical protein n=1 Tax=unclassified Methylosinus TaxID=2624500 RepID=UPI0012ED3E1D|nr:MULTISPECIES: hypothetical protein [unclassified Methylosinus]
MTTHIEYDIFEPTKILRMIEFPEGVIPFVPNIFATPARALRRAKPAIIIPFPAHHEREARHAAKAEKWTDTSRDPARYQGGSGLWLDGDGRQN